MSWSWTMEQVGILIDEMAKYPCMYNTKSVHYHNKLIRNKILEAIREVLIKSRPMVTVNDIQKKWSGLRNTYGTEYKKVQKSALSKDDIYIPSIWYYNKMDFLKTFLTNRPANESMFDSIYISDNTNELNFIKEEEESNHSFALSSSSHSSDQPPESCSESSSTPQTTTAPTRKRRCEENNNDIEDCLNIIKTTAISFRKNEETELELYGRSIAKRLSSIKDPKNLVRTRLKIEEFICEALVKEL